jgi:hypothetical protein
LIAKDVGPARDFGRSWSPLGFLATNEPTPHTPHHTLFHGRVVFFFAGSLDCLATSTDHSIILHLEEQPTILPFSLCATLDLRFAVLPDRPGVFGDA